MGHEHREQRLQEPDDRLVEGGGWEEEKNNMISLHPCMQSFVRIFLVGIIGPVPTQQRHGYQNQYLGNNTARSVGTGTAFWRAA